MAKGSWEKNIKRIIEMEDRICRCQRCSSLVRCVNKPSLGKGDLDSVITMVFESENDFTRDIKKIIELRNLIKNESKIPKIYHTYMVRCCPKSCTSLKSSSCYVEGRLLDKEFNCLLSRGRCHGIPVKPDNDEVISCLPFVIEELDILEPSIIIMFGQRVSEFVLKSFGIFDEVKVGKAYRRGEQILFSTVEQELFTKNECRQLFHSLTGDGYLIRNS